MKFKIYDYGKKMTISSFCELINSQDEWSISNNDIIRENGWDDETGTSYGICSDPSTKTSLKFNERGVAEEFYIN